MRAMAIGFVIWLLTTQVLKAASLPQGDVRAIVDQVNAESFGNWFDPLDVMAVIEVESNFDPRAYRYEASINDASIGLMQVLWSTAVDRGVNPALGPAVLYDPLTNIRAGMAQLKWSWDYLTAHLGRAPTKDEWIASYNEGVGNVVNGVADPGYVARFHSARGA